MCSHIYWNLADLYDITYLCAIFSYPKMNIILVLLFHIIFESLKSKDRQ